MQSGTCSSGALELWSSGALLWSLVSKSVQEAVKEHFVFVG